MRAVVGLSVAVLLGLICAYIATRAYDDEERSSGSGWRILDALTHLVSWWH
jgi:hypothetical protein